MKTSNGFSRSLAVSLVVAVVAIAWLLAAADNRPRRSVLATFYCTSAVAVASLLSVRRKPAVHQTTDYLRQLLECLVADRATDVPLPPPPPLSGKWLELTRALHESFAAVQSHVQLLQQRCATAEVRSRELSQQSQQLTAIIAALPDPVIAVNQFGELLLANDSAIRLLKIPGDRPARSPLRQLVDCPPLVEMLADVCHRASPVQRSAELTIGGADSEPRSYRVTCASLAAREAEPAGAVAILRDISHEKAIQKRNAEFVSAASHEMKTPLTAIRGYVELLADGDVDDDQTRDEFMQVIRAQIDRLQRLIENLLNLARIEAGVVEVNKQPQSLNALLDEALNVVQPAAECKQIQLERQLSPLYLSVLVDHDLMLQAAINLLSNAVKYTPAGGRVALRSRMLDDRVMFEVEDTGVGLSEEDQRRIFEKFYRVKKDQQMASGTGLGLPLAKHIVEDVHGGSLTVESQLGQGSTFRVTLPAARQAMGSTA